jgi:hypothetical protein
VVSATSTTDGGFLDLDLNFFFLSPLTFLKSFFNLVLTLLGMDRMLLLLVTDPIEELCDNPDIDADEDCRFNGLRRRLSDEDPLLDSVLLLFSHIMEEICVLFVSDT